MRNLIITAIINYYLHDSRGYADYLDGSHNASDRHDQICRALTRLSDDMLLSVYQRCLVGNEVIICSADEDGKYADIYQPAGKYYGGMTEDGVVHT
jgi:hypothetical protein